MRAEGIALVLRRRAPWEVADLGVAMVRRWWRPLAAAWAAVVLPVQLAVVAVACGLWGAVVGATVAIVVNWCVKALYARVALWVLARALLGPVPPLRASYRALCALVVADLAAGLTSRRWSSGRAFFAPVDQLEGLRGEAAQRRRAILGERGGALAGWCGALLWLVGVAIFCGVLELFGFFGGETATPWRELVGMEPDPLAPVQFAGLALAYYAIVGLIEVLSVAIGFALYLDRRTALEGWDIEQVLRQASARVGRRRPSLSIAARALGLALLAAPLGGQAHAATARPDDAAVRAAVQDVLAGEDFGAHRREQRWQRRPERLTRPIGQKMPPRQPEPSATRGAPRATTATPLGSLLGLLLRVLGVAAVVVLAVFLLRRARPALQRRARRRPGAAGAVELEAIEDGFAGVDADPEGVVARALGAVAAGRADLALTLLYSGALERVGERHRVEVPRDATEREAQRAVAAAAPREVVDCFGAIADARLQLVYGHLPIEDDALVGLCRRFAAVFGATGAEGER